MFIAMLPKIILLIKLMNQIVTDFMIAYRWRKKKKDSKSCLRSIPNHYQRKGEHR